MNDRRSLPLTGIRVLDLSRVLAGPVCSQILADLGAEVLKIERPGTGDDTRQWGPPFYHGASAYFLSVNRGKRSVALDLSHPKGQEILADLVRHSDVLLENFLPEASERFGLNPERLAERNPRLVTCSISGFGRTGPWKDIPGYDFVIQALSGLMSITGEADGAPLKVGVAISDVLTGLYAAVSVLAGLLARGQVGGGFHFDLSLLDCTLASLVNVAQAYLVTGQVPRRYGNAHPHIVPYQCFATADGYLVLAVGNDRQWQRFCELVGRTDWADDPRFATNPARVEHREELIPPIAELLRQKTTAAWIEQLSAADVPHAPVLSLPEVFAHPQVQARQMVLATQTTTGEPLKLVSSPIRISASARSGQRHTHAKRGVKRGRGTPQLTAESEPSEVSPYLPPPRLGEHTDEVLQQVLGYDEARCQQLREEGVIA